MNLPDHSYPWVPDQGDGTFRNPVLHADYSDPDVIRVGGDFYLTSSSFNCTPGLPILHSRDLVNWRIINHALKNLPHPRYSEVQPGQGVWAPAIRFHDGRFWIFFPTPDEGIYVITAADPAGEWSAPHLLLGGKGLIDPCPFWDDDGSAWLIHAYAGSRAGIRNKLHLRPMAPDASRTLGDGKVVFEIDPALPALEGPKLHKRNDWYYISAPAGGVATGWQSVFRSRCIGGPYEEKVVLAQRGTPINGPHQGALVDTPAGDWWFLHFQDKDFYGRIVHLQPVRWEDDWPLMGEAQDESMVGRPVLHHRKPVAGEGAIAVPQDSDEFEGQSTRAAVAMAGESSGRLVFADRACQPPAPPSSLRPEGRHRPSAEPPVAEVSSQRVLRGNPARTPRRPSGFACRPGRDGWKFRRARCSEPRWNYHLRLATAEENIAILDLGEPAVTLKLKVGEGGACSLGVAMNDSDFYQLGPSFQASPGRWIGAKVGIYCITTDVLDQSGFADFAWFRFGPLHCPLGQRSGWLKRSELHDESIARAPGAPAHSAAR